MPKAVVKKSLMVSKEIMQLIVNQQFVPEAPVYDQEDVLLTVPMGDYKVVSKDVAGNGNMKAWTAYEGKFSVNGQEVVLPYRSGIEPDEDTDCVIAMFVANRDYTTTSGKIIPKGQTRIFAVNG